MTTTDPLLRFRDEFPILATSTYLVSNSLGAMPRAVPDRLAEYTEQWRTRGVRAWAEGWWELPVTMGNEIAPLIGAAPGTVVMMPTVPFSCFFDMVQFFNFGEPAELKQLPKFPRREPAPTCEEWMRRLPPMGAPPQ